MYPKWVFIYWSCLFDVITIKLTLSYRNGSKVVEGAYYAFSNP